MTKRRRFALTFEERKLIEKNLKEGISGIQIGKLLGRSAQGINGEIRINGGKENYTAEKAHQRSIRIKEQRFEKIKQGLSDNQVKILLESFENGESITQMRKKLGCCYSTVRRYMEKMGIQFRKKEPTNIFDRIDAIESQIEIILDIIQEMRK